MIIMRGQRSLLFLFSPLIIMLLVTSVSLGGWLQGSTIYELVALLAILNLPGVYISALLKKELGLELDEFFVSNLVISSVISDFTYIYLTYIIPQVAKAHIFAALSILMVVQTMFFYYKSWDLNVYGSPRLTKVLLQEAGVILSGLVSAALVLRRLTSEIWIGNDPWETAIVCRNIVKLGLSPVEALSYYETLLTMSHPGFYYLVSLVSMVGGIDVDLIVRAGPLVFAALCGILTYLAVKRLVNPIAGLAAPLFLFLNPFFNFRFSMLLRENLSIIMLVLFFILLYIRRSRFSGASPGFIIVNGLLMGGITITHPFTAVILLAMIVTCLFFDYVDRRATYIKEMAASFTLCIIFIIPNVSPMYIPVHFFLANNKLSFISVVFTSLMVLVLSAYFVTYIKNNPNYIEVIHDARVRLSYRLAVLFIFSFIIFRPIYLSNYIYEYLQLDMFSLIVIVLGVLGFFSEPPNMRNVILSTLTFSVAALLYVFLLGITVPLDRIAVYTSWILSYYASSYIFRLVEPLTLRLVNLPLVPRDLAALLRDSQQYVLLLFSLSIIIYWNIMALNPSFTEFSSQDVGSAALFVSALEDGDLVIPYKTNYILQYNDIPRENSITTLEERVWMRDIVEIDNPVELTNNLPERLSNVKRIKYCLTFTDYFEAKDLKPSKEFLEEYCDFSFYGSLIVYTINVPYDENVRPLNKVKTVTGVSDGSILSVETSDILAVSSVSNILVDSTHDVNLYRLYCVGEDGSGVTGIWCALSYDKLNWITFPEPIILGEYSEPFVIEDSGTYRLFCEDVSSNEVICFSSRDGVLWSNRTVIVANQDASIYYWRASSPVIWADGGSYHMIYEETTVSTQGPNVCLVQLTSDDFWSWRVENKPLLLWPVDDSFWTVKFDRLLFDDVAITDEGTMFIVRALKSNFETKTWVTGTLLVKPERPDQTYFQEIELTNLPTSSSTVDSVHVLQDPGTGTPIFYIYERGSSDCGEGLYVGYPIAAHINPLNG